MGQRPTRMPRFAYSASALLVEPTSDKQASGFPARYEPPAQWFNYLFHYALAWSDYLRGPGWGAWTRAAHGSATAFTAVTGLAVDTSDSRARDQRVRYAVIGLQSGPATHVNSSKNGLTWTDRSAPTSSTALYGITCIDSTWYVWGTTGSFAVWSTPADTGANNCALRTGTAGHWTAIAALAGSRVRGIVAASTLDYVALRRTSAGQYDIVASSDAGLNWTFTAGGVWTGGTDHACAIVYDDSRLRVLIGSMLGEIKALGASGAWTTGVSTLGTLSGIAADVLLNLRVGGPADSRTLIAWASFREDGTTALAASQLWRSTDGGTTWSAITAASPGAPAEMTASGGAGVITDVQHVDGTWIATTTAAPYLWRSDDDGQNWERLPLPVAEESSWALYRAVYADGQIVATGLTWTVYSTRASATSPGTWTSREPVYLADAGSLRGRTISTTAPTSGQVLGWNATTSKWEGTTMPWTTPIAPDDGQTTDATTTTIATIATTTNKGHALDLVVSAAQSDRSASVAFKVLASVTNAAGVCTVRSQVTTASDGGASTWTVVVDVSGTNIRVRVTGALATTIDWVVAGTMLVHGS